MVFAAARRSLIALTSAMAAGSISTFRPRLAGDAGVAAGGCCCAWAADTIVPVNKAAATRRTTAEVVIWLSPDHTNDRQFRRRKQSPHHTGKRASKRTSRR